MSGTPNNPAVGPVPVEVPEEAVEAAAKAVADLISPPVEFERWDRESREFVMERSERGPDDQAYVSFIAGDGIRSTRGATYREVVAAAYPLIAAQVRAEERQRIRRQLVQAYIANPEIGHDYGVNAGLTLASAAVGDPDVAAGSAVPVATPEPTRAQLARWIGNTVDPAQSGFDVRRQCIEVIRSAEPIPPPVATPTEPVDGEYTKVFHQHEDGAEVDGPVRDCVCSTGGVVVPEVPV